MPSGAKRRKAAKKKKEQEANLNSSANNNLQGNDDVRSQDERESDSGEVGSPASGDQHNQQHPFKEGNGISENRDQTENKSMESFPRDVEGAQNTGQERDGDVIVEKVLKPEDDLESKSVSIERVKSLKDSHDGHDGSSSSSSSSSDDESPAVEKKSGEKAYNSAVEVIANEDEPNISSSLYETSFVSNVSFAQVDNNSVLQSVPVVDLVQPVVSESKEEAQVRQNAIVENSVIPDAVEVGLKEIEEKLVPTSDEVIAVSVAVSDSVPMKNEHTAFPVLNESVCPSVVEAKTTELPPTSIAQTSNGHKNLKDSEIPECSENQPLVASAPRVVQRTSWLSCCGLFDVITGGSK